jgi:hypothetical protein
VNVAHVASIGSHTVAHVASIGSHTDSAQATPPALAVINCGREAGLPYSGGLPPVNSHAAVTSHNPARVCCESEGG